MGCQMNALSVVYTEVHSPAWGPRSQGFKGGHNISQDEVRDTAAAAS